MGGADAATLFRLLPLAFTVDALLLLLLVLLTLISSRPLPTLLFSRLRDGGADPTMMVRVTMTDEFSSSAAAAWAAAWSPSSDDGGDDMMMAS